MVQNKLIANAGRITESVWRSGFPTAINLKFIVYASAMMNQSAQSTYKNQRISWRCGDVRCESPLMWRTG